MFSCKRFSKDYLKINGFKVSNRISQPNRTVDYPLKTISWNGCTGSDHHQVLTSPRTSLETEGPDNHASPKAAAKGS